jgi:hypothetical protein
MDAIRLSRSSSSVLRMDANGMPSPCQASSAASSYVTTPSASSGLCAVLSSPLITCV